MSASVKTSTLSNTQNYNNAPYLVSGLVFLLFCRLVAMIWIPLNDSTEARYAEIARKMLETNNWVTLFHDYGIPFWGKPPLSTWLSALSMRCFGINEFAARLPSLILSCGTLGLIYSIAKRRLGSLFALAVTLILASNLAFIIDAGAVMTDPALLFSITLILVAFWRSVIEQSRTWGYLFFLGLGLGLLAKGPIAIVLTATPIFFWSFLYKKWGAIGKNLPWFLGLILTACIALPWYVLAEIRTPGFFNYFIMGEHFGRFLVKGWQGDKYGFAHSAPYGMIFLYALLAIFPWTFSVFYWLIRHGKKIPTLCKDSDGWASYWLLVACTPLLFFAVARNIIWPYILPSLPAFALLFIEFSIRNNHALKLNRSMAIIASLTGLTLLLGTAIFIFRPEWIEKSQKPVVNAWKNQHPAFNSHLIYWTPKSNPNFSAHFYAKGRILETTSGDELKNMLSTGVNHYLVLESSPITPFPNELLSHMTKIKTILISNKRYVLYGCT